MASSFIGLLILIFVYVGAAILSQLFTSKVIKPKTQLGMLATYMASFIIIAQILQMLIGYLLTLLAN